MSQREYEIQPEAPDLGEFIQEESGETLVGPPGTDPLDAGYVPPDRPYGLDDPQAVARGNTDTEDLDTRLRRERPDVTPEDPSGGENPDPDRSGRLEGSAAGADGRYAHSMEGVDDGVAGGAASAEEAAVHDRDGGDVGAVE